MEALIGAIILDESEVAALEVIQRLFLADLDLDSVGPDPTSEYCGKWKELFREEAPKPEYRYEGPDDDRTWWATVALPSGAVVEGEGRGKRKEARKAACAVALSIWEDA